MGTLVHKSLLAQGHALSETEKQLNLLQEASLPCFETKLKESNLYPLTAIGVDVFQINIGKMCNQVCKHCHVDAGPDRKEIMTRETMKLCLDAIDKTACSTVDLTGGAPEMNPNFRWFVAQLSARRKKILVRCNLTIIVANKSYNDLPEFFKKHNVEVVSSLPYFNSKKTDAQRGSGVFDKSIEALKMLNAVGYGCENSGLILNLVYNPSGAFLPPDQSVLEVEFKAKLRSQFDIVFNQLFTITNLPISRYLQYLIASENYQGYMEKLVNAYNPVAASTVMCRTTLSISWDGFIFDCDFNQMLDLKVSAKDQHISAFNIDDLLNRIIIVNQHCYGCTAGAGSSCGGELT
ncbi:MAG: arsenosugar biosynthesis radical SAM protein ArsS [Crocinitomicaceae bacterium]|nr:arsenosugar biosynthesis radical SAM protein ArsS [Crocinitomicaceae bacterium]MDG1776362.1 arsenosugar biosynthesis radical SAM protein ArsS [Crocinitomicaceae bacterium]